MGNSRFKFRVFNKLWDCYSMDDHYIDEDGDLNILRSEYVIEQCTGLKDKNGNLIYEGDFLEYKGEVCLVFWNDAIACFGVMLQDSKYTDYAGDIKRSDLYSIDGEVIGNIHENKELLDEN